jgi:hypothetical protein
MPDKCVAQEMVLQETVSILFISFYNAQTSIIAPLFVCDSGQEDYAEDPRLSL